MKSPACITAFFMIDNKYPVVGRRNNRPFSQNTITVQPARQYISIFIIYRIRSIMYKSVLIVILCFDSQFPEDIIRERHRSEERRVGKECRWRWARRHERQKETAARERRER